MVISVMIISKGREKKLEKHDKLIKIQELLKTPEFSSKTVG